MLNFLLSKISELPEVEINLKAVQTNIVTFKPVKLSVEEVIDECKKNGLLLSSGKVGWVRAVTHLDISNQQIKMAAEILSKILK